MILLADSGSTKTNWALLKPQQGIRYFDTEGYNPYFVSSDYIVNSIKNQFPIDVQEESVQVIYFYGAGCFEDKIIIIQKALNQIFPKAQVEAGLDLLGSARSVLGDQPGFAAILGTGTNSCLYDGSRITANIDSLGYLLGDEGSGYYIGKKLLGDYIRAYMPENLREEFYKTYGLSREHIMEKIYSEELPNRYCASFTRFISDSVSDKKYTRQLVKSSFIDFFECLVTKYPGYQQYTFNCTGSIGFGFRDILAETVGEYKMKMGTIIQSPIEGLAQFHLQELPSQ